MVSEKKTNMLSTVCYGDFIAIQIWVIYTSADPQLQNRFHNTWNYLGIRRLGRTVFFPLSTAVMLLWRDVTAVKRRRRERAAMTPVSTII